MNEGNIVYRSNKTYRKPVNKNATLPSRMFEQNYVYSFRVDNMGENRPLSLMQKALDVTGCDYAVSGFITQASDNAVNYHVIGYCS
jgi:hypothetical protein